MCASVWSAVGACLSVLAVGVRLAVLLWAFWCQSNNQTPHLGLASPTMVDLQTTQSLSQVYPLVVLRTIENSVWRVGLCDDRERFVSRHVCAKLERGSRRKKFYKFCKKQLTITILPSLADNRPCCTRRRVSHQPTNQPSKGRPLLSVSVVDVTMAPTKQSEVRAWCCVLCMS